MTSVASRNSERQNPGSDLRVATSRSLCPTPTSRLLRSPRPPIRTIALVRAALEAGKHVLVEKPLARTADEAAELMELADELGLTLMPGHTFLYSPAVNKVRNLIQDGTLGEIYFVTSSRMNLGKYQQDGVVLDLAPHDLSILLHWLGKPLLEVTANGRSVYQEGVHETAFLTLAFEGGAQANVQLSWLAPRKMRQMVVVGSKQMVQYEDTSADASVRIYDRGMDFSAAARKLRRVPADLPDGRHDRSRRSSRPSHSGSSSRTSPRQSSRALPRLPARGSGSKWYSRSRRSSALSNLAANRSRSRGWSRFCAAAPRRPRRRGSWALAPPRLLKQPDRASGPLRQRERRPRGNPARPGRSSPSERQWRRRRCRASSPRASGGLRCGSRA